MQRLINLRHTSSNEVFSKSYTTRSRGLKEEIQYFLSNATSDIASNSTSPGLNHDEQFIGSNSSGDERAYSMLFRHSKDSNSSNNYKQKPISSHSIQNIAARTKLDSTALNSYLRFTSKLLKSPEVNYEDFIDEYRAGEVPIHNAIGYKSNPWRLLLKSNSYKENVAGEIVVNRLKSLLAEMVNVEPKDLIENHKKFQHAFNEVVIKLAQCGYKDFSGLVLENLNLSKQKFIDCTFQGSNFCGATLSHTTFENCNLEGCWLYSTELEGCGLINCKIEIAKFDSKEQASEINMVPNFTLFRDCWFKQYTKNDPITKDVVFSIVNAMSDMHNDRAVELTELIKKPLPSGKIINRECLIILENVDLDKACVVKEPNGTIRLYDASELWKHFKSNPNECPLRHKIETLKFMSINDIYMEIKS